MPKPKSWNKTDDAKLIRLFEDRRQIDPNKLTPESIELVIGEHWPNRDHKKSRELFKSKAAKFITDNAKRGARAITPSPEGKLTLSYLLYACDIYNFNSNINDIFFCLQTYQGLTRSRRGVEEKRRKLSHPRLVSKTTKRKLTSKTIASEKKTTKKKTIYKTTNLDLI